MRHETFDVEAWLKKTYDDFRHIRDRLIESTDKLLDEMDKVVSSKTEPATQEEPSEVNRHCNSCLYKNFVRKPREQDIRCQFCQSNGYKMWRREEPKEETMCKDCDWWKNADARCHLPLDTDGCNGKYYKSTKKEEPKSKLDETKEFQYRMADYIYYGKQVKDKDKEINRLRNIIKELEEACEIRIEYIQKQGEEMHRLKKGIKLYLKDMAIHKRCVNELEELVKEE
jgi:hypothetical protein